MKKEEFNKIIDEQIKKCLDTLISKATEYDRDDSDRLKDFKQAGVLSGTNQLKALQGMFAKQIVSLFNYITDGIHSYEFDKVYERITDSINYLLILKAMCVEEQSKFLNYKGNKDE